MLETVSLVADINDVKDVERFLQRCGRYLDSGYRLLNFSGNEKIMEASFGTREEKRIGFVNE